MLGIYNIMLDKSNYGVNMKKFEKLIMFGVIALIIGIFLEIYFPNDDFIPINIISFGSAMICIVIMFKVFKRDQEPAKDERIIKINHMSLANSWWLTYVVIAILYWVNRYYPMTADSILGLVMFFMVVTYAIFVMYFNRKEVSY